MRHDELIARVGPEATAPALAGPHVRPFDITGRAMSGWVVVESDGIDTEQQLGDWLGLAAAFVGTLRPSRRSHPRNPNQLVAAGPIDAVTRFTNIVA